MNSVSWTAPSSAFTRSAIPAITHHTRARRPCGRPARGCPYFARVPVFGAFRAGRLPGQWWQAGPMGEQPLPGGFVTTVVRAGNTVRRAPPEDPEFVRALLRLFERRGWAGAPRFLGTDERGREVLSFIDGHVAWEPVQPPSITSDASLARLAGLVREFHDL